LVARIYTAISKHLNYQLKKHLDSKQPNTLELDIPYLGTVIAKAADQLEFAVAQTLSDEAGGGLNGSRLEMGRKQSQRQELNLGKIAEVCQTSREQVKTVL